MLKTLPLAFLLFFSLSGSAQLTLVKDIDTTIQGFSQPTVFTIYKEKIYCDFGLPNMHSPFRRALWSCKLNGDSVSLIKDYNNIDRFYEHNNELYFTTENALAKTDGTGLGSNFIFDSNGGFIPFYGQNMAITSFNKNKLAFAERTGYTGHYTRDKIWITDGTNKRNAYFLPIDTAFKIPYHLYAKHIVNYDNNLFYSTQANGKQYPYLIYKTDGTLNGTVKMPWTSPFKPIVFQNSLILSGRVGTTNPLWGLYNSDGTVSGTKQIDTISYELIQRIDSGILMTVNNRLWLSKGTKYDAVQLGNIVSASAINSSGWDPITRHSDGYYYFPDTNSAGNWDLAKTNGTPSGTVRVGGSLPSGFLFYGNIFSGDSLIYYTITNSYTSSQRTIYLASSDGKSPNVKIDSFLINQNRTEIYYPSFSNGNIVFQDAQVPSGHSGTPTNVYSYNIKSKTIKKIEPNYNKGIEVTQKINTDERLYFKVKTAIAAYRDDIYVSDGTTSGTKIIKAQIPSEKSHMDTLGKELLFVDVDINGHSQLAVTANNGNSYSIITGFSGSVKNEIYWIKAAGKNNAYFNTNSGFYKTDGTVNGTIRITNEIPYPIDEFYTVGTTLYMMQEINFSIVQDHFWVSDGTAIGTHQISGNGDILSKSIRPTRTGVYYKYEDLTGIRHAMFCSNTSTKSNEFGVFDSIKDSQYLSVYEMHGLYFFFEEQNGIQGPYVSDGTSSGTRLVIKTDLNYNGYQGVFSKLNGYLYIGGSKFLKTDGTVARTSIIKDFDINNTTDDVTEMHVHEGLLYLSAKSPIYGRELWVSNGTSSGTHLFKDEEIGTGGSSPSSFLPLKAQNSFVYLGQDYKRTIYFNSLFRTNGSTCNYEKVIEQHNNILSPALKPDIIENKLLVFHRNPSKGIELHSYDFSERPDVDISVSNPILCSGDTVAIKAETKNIYTNATWRWQTSSDGGLSWTNLQPSNKYIGIQTDSLSIQGVSGYSLYRASFTANGVTTCAYSNVYSPNYLKSRTTSQPVSCFNAKNGIAEVIPNYDFKDLKYQWSNGDTSRVLFGKAAGNYQVTVSGKTGCQIIDSVKIKSPVFISSSQNVSICKSGKYSIGSSIYTVSGTFTDSLITGPNNCDSVVTTHLTVKIVNASVGKDINKLFALGTGNYQWLDCDKGLLLNNTRDTLNISKSGFYALIKTENGCLDTSDCEFIEFVTVSNSIDNVQLKMGISIHPNPTSSQVNINFKSINDLISIDLINNSGQILETRNAISEYSQSFDLTAQPAGSYFLLVNSKLGLQKFQIIKL